MLHVTATTLATFFSRESCKRYLLLETSKGRPNRGEVPTLLAAQFEKGIQWEEKICQTIDPLIRCPFTNADEANQWSLDILRGQNQELMTLLQKNERVFIHGTLFHVPDRFYTTYNISKKDIFFSYIKPDFLIVQLLKDEKQQLILDIQIIDAKASTRLKISHQIQVSFYAHVLEEVTASFHEESKQHFTTQINIVGGIWMPEANIQGERQIGDITLFQRLVFHSVLSKVYRLLEVLHGRDGLDPSASEWYFSPKCSLCNFKEICRNDALQLRRVGCIPNLTTGTQSWLTGLLPPPPKREDLPDIEELHRLVQPDMPLHITATRFYPSERRKLFASLNLYPDGSSPVLDSVRSQTLQHRRASSLEISYIPADIQIFMSIMLDPLTELPYSFASCTTITATLEQQTSQICQRELSVFLSEFMDHWNNLLDVLNKKYHNHTVSFFVRTLNEKKIILQLLIEIILSRSAYSKDAETIFLHLEDDASCLNCSEQPDLFEIQGTPMAPRITVLQNIIQHLFAVPSPGYHQFNEYFSYLSGTSTTPTATEEEVYSAMIEGKYELACQQLKDITTAMYHCTKAIRASAFDYCADVGDLPTQRLIAKASKMTDVKVLHFEDPILQRIVFICQYESILERQEYLEKRMLGPEATSIAEIQILTWNRDEKRYRCSVRNGLEQLTESNGLTFFNWIAIEKRHLSRLCSFNDFHWMSQFFGYKAFKPPIHPMSIVNIESIQIGEDSQAESIIIISNNGDYWKPGDTILLVPRVVNFNVKKIMTKAREISKKLASGGKSEFIDLISDPIQWATRKVSPLTIEMVQRKGKILQKIYNDAAALAGALHSGYSENVKKLKFLMSQRRAFDQVALSRLTLVWGPPGTGKTHFLALSILRFIEIAFRMNQPLKVLVTAYTNTAIDKLIEKTNEFLDIEKEVYQGVDGGDWIHQVRISRAISSGKVVPFEKEGFDVIGSTCWQMKKISTKFQFDVVIVDEGSQLPVSAAMLVIDRIKAGGRLIVAGDHHQLGPVLRGRYPTGSEFSVQGSLLESLLRTSKGKTIHVSNIPFMKAEELSNTVMLHENNRMNKSLNDFTQRIYNGNYKASHPSKTLPIHPYENLVDIPRVCSDILCPALYKYNAALCSIEIKVKRQETEKEFPLSLSHEFQLRYERDFIERLIDGFIFLVKQKPSIFVVVPHRSQRSSIKELLKKEKYADYEIQADTVDRMQGQEADIVIVSYLFFDALQVATESEFLFDRRRLNVSISRAEKFCLFLGSESIFDPPVEVLASPLCGDAYQHLLYFTDCCKELNSYFSITATLQNGMLTDSHSVVTD